MNEKEASCNVSAMARIGNVVVKLRWLIIVIFIALSVLCVRSIDRVNTYSDIDSLMPEDSESLVGQSIIAEEFKSFGGCRIVIDGTDVEQTELLCEKLRSVAHVAQVVFSEDTDLVGGSALVSVFFDPGLQSDSSRGVINSIKRELDGYSFGISSDIDTGSSTGGSAEQARTLVIFAVALLIILALVTSSFGELPVLILTLLVSAILNLGSDFMLGSISYISRELSVFVQLSLTAFCAFMMCSRFRAERSEKDSKTAAVCTFAATAPAVLLCGFASAGILFVMSFMSFRLGADLSYVLMKAAACSMLTLLFFTPSLLAVLGNAIDVSVHKSLLPKPPYKALYSKPLKVLLPVLLVLLIISGFFVMQNRQCSYGLTRTDSVQESRELQNIIDSRFGGRQIFTVLIPSGDYEAELELADTLSECEGVVGVLGLDYARLSDGTSIFTTVSTETFDEFIALDPAVKQAVFALFAAENGDHNDIDDITGYNVQLIDFIDFLYEKCASADSGLNLEAEQVAAVNALHDELLSARSEFEGKEYSRITVCLQLPSHSDNIRLFVDSIKQTISQYYPDNVYIAGDFMTDYELFNSSEDDSMPIPLLSSAVAFVLLALTCGSVITSLLLTLIVSGSVWISLAAHAVGGDAGFVCCLIAGSILLCLNVCSAIGISSRYREARRKGMGRVSAAAAAAEQCFSAGLGAGLTALAAGLSLWLLVSDSVISEIGICITIGAPICTLITVLITPRLLIVSDFGEHTAPAAVSEKPVNKNANLMLRRCLGLALALISAAMLILVPYTENGISASADSTAKLCSEQLSEISTLDQINTKLDMAQKQYEGTKLLFAESYVTEHYVKDQLEEGEDQYYLGKKQLENGEYMYNQSKAQYEAGQAAYDQALAQYNAGEEAYEAGLAEYNAALEQYNAAQSEVDKVMGIYNTVMPLYETYLWYEQQYQDAVEKGNTLSSAALYPMVSAGRTAFQTALGGYGSLSDLINYVNAAKTELSAAKSELDAANEVLTASKANLDLFKKSLDETASQLEAADAQLQYSRYQLDAGRSSLNNAKKQLKEGQQKVEENQELLAGSLANLDQYADEQEKLIQGTELVLEVSAIRELVGKDATYGDIFTAARSYYNDLLVQSQRQVQLAKLTGAIFTAAAVLAIVAALLLILGKKGLLPFVPGALSALACAAGFTLCRMFGSGYELLLICAAVLCLTSIFSAAIAIKSRPAAVKAASAETVIVGEEEAASELSSESEAATEEAAEEIAVSECSESEKP